MNFRNFCFFSILAFVFSQNLFSQTDTLRLNYYYTQVAPHDSNVAKIDKWVKGLNGRKVNVNTYAYYYKASYKELSEQRLKELFIILSRKARAQITFGEQKTKKGDESEKGIIHIAYSFADSKPTTDSKPEPKKTDVAKESKPKSGGPAKDIAKEEKAKEKDAEKAKEKEREREKQAQTVAKEKEKQSEVVQTPDDQYVYDSVYVNGALKVTKRKRKAAQAVAKQKEKQNETVQPLDDRYTYDSVYVNGALEVIKHKKKK